MRKEVWIKGPHRHLGYKMLFLMKGIRFEVYPREKDIHTFQVPFDVQEHWEKKNPNDELLLADLRNFQVQNLWIVNGLIIIDAKTYHLCTKKIIRVLWTSGKLGHGRWLWS